ncbi:MAG: sugar phosphate nucleotidyltransferase [bacterium]|nr:sugar phosphate nucleotidyltransferase [bacterium]
MKIRKAILTGGGRATRLRPVTSTINKHLIPLANKPMIFHAIQKAVDAGIEEIFINTNPGETDLPKHIGDGGHWGIKIKFFEQTGGPQGIAHVVKEAEQFVGDEPFMFYLSDNVILGSLVEAVDEFTRGRYDCMLAFAKVPDASHFGVPIFDATGKLVDIVEKPKDPPHNLAQTGIYFYGPKVFFDAYENISKSARGEYEISSIHSYFLKNDYKVGHREITGWWKDTGQPTDLITANQFLMDEMPAEAFQIEGQIDPSAVLSGKVKIGVGTSIGENVRIQGPVIIAENCTLENCTILPYTTIGVGCEIKNTEIASSIIFGNCRIDCPLKISESIIGESVIIKKHPASMHRLILGSQTVLEV